jgi:hypothetical protein
MWTPVPVELPSSVNELERDELLVGDSRSTVMTVLP